MQYDIADIPRWTSTLRKEGYELGVHGIDAWHSVNLGKEELRRVSAVAENLMSASGCTGCCRTTILIASWRTLAMPMIRPQDTTRPGLSQWHNPGFSASGLSDLLEVPMHIQDGALFFPERLDLSESAAWDLCELFIANANRFGGVLTLLWHDRSHGPERFWGEFYVRLVQKLRSLGVWFGTAAQVVNWFQKRREVIFRYVDIQEMVCRLNSVFLAIRSPALGYKSSPAK